MLPFWSQLKLRTRETGKDRTEKQADNRLTPVIWIEVQVGQII